MYAKYPNTVYDTNFVNISDMHSLKLVFVASFGNFVARFN